MVLLKNQSEFLLYLIRFSFLFHEEVLVVCH